jgi:hypothetical protein
MRCGSADLQLLGWPSIVSAIGQLGTARVAGPTTRLPLERHGSSRHGTNGSSGQSGQWSGRTGVLGPRRRSSAGGKMRFSQPPLSKAPCVPPDRNTFGCEYSER